ncbi:HAD-IA family hydrolase [Dactylosporangium sp. NPDC051485]|uniref:HAD family hydrolase n=1 Tax=Dactylosporangium sp. NPDC051485 TaxID=3154846 RepID=UPI00343AB0DC
MTPGRPDALLFDFDGVLVDTETSLWEAWCVELRGLGIVADLAAYRKLSFLDPPSPLAARVAAAVAAAGGAPGFAPEAAAARISARNLERAGLLEARPGVRELLADARRMGIATAVVSSSSRAWVLAHLRRLDVAGQFDLVLCREDVARRKPAPDGYRDALRRLRLTANRCLAIEDSPHGVRAARAAGLRCLAVPGPLTAGLDFSLADEVRTGLDGVVLTSLLADRPQRPDGDLR